MPDAKTIPIRLEAVLLALTTTTGMIDAVCYLGHGACTRGQHDREHRVPRVCPRGAKGFTISSFIVAIA